MKPLLLLSCLLVSNLLSAQNIANIGLESVELTPTEKVFNFYAWNFEDIVAFQFSMHYDESKMVYQTIQNVQVTGFSVTNIGKAMEGVLVTAWLNLELEADFPLDSFVLFRVIFDIVEPGGSGLCFSNVPLGYEFISEETELSEIIIHDDCNTGLLLVLNPTNTTESKEEFESPISHLFLSREGKLAFTVHENQWLDFQLYTITGQEVNSVLGKRYSTGRNYLDLHQSILPGMYFLHVMDGNGRNFSTTLWTW